MRHSCRDTAIRAGANLARAAGTVDCPLPRRRHGRCGGKLRLLGVGSARRSALAPDAPTLAEAGVPGFEAGTFFGIFAPAATPRSVVVRLNEAINRALLLPELRERNLRFEP